MPSSQSQKAPLPKPNSRKTFEPAGCARCGTTKSSSFRRDQETGNRLCNSCHCKLYRLKRKAAELDRQGQSDGSSDSADRSDSTPHRRPSKHIPELLVMQVPARQHSLPLPALNSLTPPAPMQSLPDLQWRVLEEARHAAGTPSITATLHSAYRAQLATPGCNHRVVLGVLPKLDLTGLPGDPPGMRYPVACLLEAVMPAAAAGSAQWGGDSAAEVAALQRDAPEAALLRTTVFGPAGALACWHEGPADPGAGEAYSPFSKAPVWCSGPGGFCLEFCGGHLSPQLNLFMAIHRQVLSHGASVLHRAPVLSLSQACMGPSFCLGATHSLPVHVATQQQHKHGSPGAGAASAVAEAAGAMHIPLPTPGAAAQPAARVHSPQQAPPQPVKQEHVHRAGMQQRWLGEAFGSGNGGAPHSPLTSVRLDGLELPALSLSCSLPSELFDPSCFDFIG